MSIKARTFLMTAYATGMRVSELCGLDDFGVDGFRAAVTDVFADRTMQQGRILRHHGNLRAQSLLRRV